MWSVESKYEVCKKYKKFHVTRVSLSTLYSVSVCVFCVFGMEYGELLNLALQSCVNRAKAKAKAKLGVKKIVSAPNVRSNDAYFLHTHFTLFLSIPNSKLESSSTSSTSSSSSSP